MPEQYENSNLVIEQSQIVQNENPDYDPYLDELKDHIENGNIPENTTLHKAATQMLLEAGVIINKLEPSYDQLEYQTDFDIDKLINKVESSTDCTFSNNEAEALIETGNVELFFNNTEKFKNLDENIANYLINKDLGEVLAQRLDYFHNLNYENIANNLIETGKGWYVAFYLDKFEGLNHVDIANRLINTGDFEYIADYLDNFQGLDHISLANHLIQNDGIWDLLNNLDKFSNLDASIADKLIEEDGGCVVIDNLSSFQSQYYDHIVDKLLVWDGSLVEYLLKDLDKFQGVDCVNIANRLIDDKRGQIVAFYIDKFQGLDYVAVANRLIDDGDVVALLNNLEKFQGLDHVSIVNRLINSNYAYRLTEYLDKFQDVDHVDIANRLIDAKKGRSVITHLDKFQGIDYKDVANRLIDSQQGEEIATYLDKFQNVDHVDIANRLIDKYQGKEIPRCLNNFQGLNHVDIANRLIANHDGRNVAAYLDNFQGLDYKDIANRLAGSNDIWGLAANLDNFQGLDHVYIANLMIDANRVEVLESCLDDFEIKNLDANIANRLLDMGKKHFIHSLKCFDSLPGDRIIDILEYSDNTKELIKNHLFRFTDIPENNLIELREKLNMPNLINMPREKAGENGEVVKPSENALDRWYGDLSYTYMEGGFNKAAIGHLIRLRIEHGMNDNIHDASQWLSTFRIPENSYDINAILNQRGSENFNEDSIEEYSKKLIDKGSEIQFFLKLLNSDQQLRNRLNYEGIKQEISSEEKLQDIFTSMPSLKNNFNAELGKDTSRLTEAFYSNLLANDLQIRQHYDEAVGGGTAQRKFFKDLLKDNKDLQDQFNSQREQMLTNLKTSFYDSALQQNPELAANKSKVNTPTNNEDWFFTPEAQLLFRAATSEIDGKPLYKHTDFSMDILFERANGLSNNFIQTTTFGAGKEETAHNLNEEQLKKRLSEMYEKMHFAPIRQDRLGETVQQLARTKLARQNYITDTQNWLKRHAVAPQELLTKTWGDRAFALANGENDSAKAINSWQSRFALNKMANGLNSTGVLQAEYNLTIKDVVGEESKPITTELTRRLSAIDTIKAISKLKKWERKRSEKSVESILPPANISVEIKKSNYNLEILDKKDPRGFTIGEDTYCCMTIDGASKSCIKAGYTKENCGFVAVSNSNENLVAQSFWYINPEVPDTLVMDNIEANDGQDLAKVAEIYRQALTNYLKSHPELNITKVHVGTGYTDINLSDMPIVETSKPLNGIYTDAKKQRLLLDLAAKG